MAGASKKLPTRQGRRVRPGTGPTLPDLPGAFQQNLPRLAQDGRALFSMTAGVHGCSPGEFKGNMDIMVGDIEHARRRSFSFISEAFADDFEFVTSPEMPGCRRLPRRQPGSRCCRGSARWKG